MAKAVLEFDLTDPDDRLEFERASKSLGMAMAIWEFVYNTKKSMQWDLEAKDSTTDAEYELLDKVYDKFWEILKDNDISPDKLIV
jgi:hypothetical protein